MLELGTGAQVLRGGGWVVWAVLLLALGLAVLLPKSRKSKFLWATLILAACAILVGPSLFRSYEFEERQSKAREIFAIRCKAAGEKIHRVIENVDAVALLKIRPKRMSSKQYEMFDPYGRDVGGEGYISSFLKEGKSAGSSASGFMYVDVSGSDGDSVQYELISKNSPAGIPYKLLQPKKNRKQKANFGVTYEDISLKEDRDYWIAGGALRVIDLRDRSIVAERVGYIWDPAMGKRSGGRNPWEGVVSCSNEDDRKYGHNARFVMRALKPSRGEN